MTDADHNNRPPSDLPVQLKELPYDTKRLDERFQYLKTVLVAAHKPAQASGTPSRTPVTAVSINGWRRALPATAIAAILLFSLILWQRGSDTNTATPWSLETVETLWEIEDQMQAVAALLDADFRNDFLFLIQETNHD